MKLGSVLLVNLLLIGASLYAYDSWKGPQRRRATEPAEEYDAFDHLRADAPREPPVRDPEGSLLGADGMRTAELVARIESLEGALARLRRQVASGAVVARSDAGSGSPEVPAATFGDLGDLADPTFDDRSVASFEAYLDEVNRRKAVERQRGVIAGQLTRLELNLTEQERAAVINETLAYHQRISKLYQVGWPKDEGDRQRRRDDFAKLHRAFKTNLEGLVAADAAEKISTGRIGRSRGFIRGAQRGEK